MARNLADDLIAPQRQPKLSPATQRSTYEHDNVRFHHHQTEDRLAILERSRLALTIDARDWNALGQLFTDTVYTTAPH